MKRLQKIKTRRIILDDLIKDYLKVRGNNPDIFEILLPRSRRDFEISFRNLEGDFEIYKNGEIKVDVFYGDSIEVTISHHITFDKVWTDSESSDDEEEIYSISYDKIKVSEDLMIQLFEKSSHRCGILKKIWTNGVPE